jgi:hypothetical protein
MIKKLLLFVVTIFMGSMTAVNAKINYVPLYIVDTKPDVTTVKRAPAYPLFITQNDHKLTLPEFIDSMAIKLFKDDQCVFETAYQPTVVVPATLTGDYEIRLCADTYCYYGFITLEMKPEIPSETRDWENITLLESNTVLDNLMKLHAIEYDVKYPYPLFYMTEEEKEAVIKKWQEEHAGRVGMLIDELKALFPQLVDSNNEMIATAFFPILISCIQELKTQLDDRTEALVDIMMSRGADYSAVRRVSVDNGVGDDENFLCTMNANGNHVGTKRLVKSK